MNMSHRFVNVVNKLSQFNGDLYQIQQIVAYNRESKSRLRLLA